MLIGLIKTMRPRQWLKNVFIFAPLIFDVKLFKLQYLAPTVGGFFLLCLISGTVYIINDLADIEEDRNHPKKRHRPLPAGEISVGLAGRQVPAAYQCDEGTCTSPSYEAADERVELVLIQAMGNIAVLPLAPE